jgi:hypothetical protein
MEFFYQHNAPKVWKTDCVEKSPIKNQPPKGWWMEASTPQSRRGKFAMRSYTACTAAAEYCEQPQPKMIEALLLIAPDFCISFIEKNKRIELKEIENYLIIPLARLSDAWATGRETCA